MATSWKHHAPEARLNYWPGLADMLVATCMLLVIFWIVGHWDLNREREKRESEAKQSQDKSVEIAELNKELEELRNAKTLAKQKREELERDKGNADATVERLTEEKQSLTEENKKLKENLRKHYASLERQLQELEIQLEEFRKRHNEPPNIVLSEAENFTFQFGKAEPTSEFTESFRRDIMPSIVDALNSPANVEVVEIVGHTDAEPIGSSRSNLDRRVRKVFEGDGSVSELQFGSNCDLGLARAIATRRLLDECLASLASGVLSGKGLTEEGRRRLDSIIIRTYSAGQLFPAEREPAQSGQNTGGSKGVAADRRIEIRFTRLRSDR